MDRAAVIVISSSHGANSGRIFCTINGPILRAPAAIPSVGNSALVAGMLYSQGNHDDAVAYRRKLNRSSRSWVSSSRRFGGCKARGLDGNYSFHKRQQPPTRCNKMFVPGFGEKSPEAKAADSLHNFFTFLAVKIVLSQLQDYNKEGYEDLMNFVDRFSLKDGDKFCAALMRESFRHKGLGACPALRIMEVRSAYTSHDFEWDNLHNLCEKHMKESNTQLMRDFLVETSEFKK